MPRDSEEEVQSETVDQDEFFSNLPPKSSSLFLKINKSEDNKRSVSPEQRRISLLNIQNPQNSSSVANRQNSLIKQIYSPNFSRLKSDERFVGQISEEDEKIEDNNVIYIENAF